MNKNNKLLYFIYLGSILIGISLSLPVIAYFEEKNLGQSSQPFSKIYQKQNLPEQLDFEEVNHEINPINELSKVPAITNSTPLPTSTNSSSQYQNLTSEQKLKFICQQARRISRMISAREEEFSLQECKSIQLFLDNYAIRITSKNTKIWQGSINTILQEAAINYAPEIIEAFEKENIPPQIGLYLALIESEYHECLTSPAGAKGMFQFMPATAQQYGLSPDERCDWKKSAHAAAKYMKDRFSQFGVDGGSVTLAIAGYNRGPQSVMRDVTQVLDKSNEARTFWTLANQGENLDRYFKQENIKYVPKFFAAAIIGENPWAFGIKLAALSTYRKKNLNALPHSAF